MNGEESGWARSRMGKASSGKCNRIVQDAPKSLEWERKAIAARFGLASWLLFSLGCRVTGQSKASQDETPRSSPTVTRFIMSVIKIGGATHL